MRRKLLGAEETINHRTRPDDTARSYRIRHLLRCFKVRIRSRTDATRQGDRLRLASTKGLRD